MVSNGTPRRCEWNSVPSFDEFMPRRDVPYIFFYESHALDPSVFLNEFQAVKNSRRPIEPRHGDKVAFILHCGWNGFDIILGSVFSVMHFQLKL